MIRLLSSILLGFALFLAGCSSSEDSPSEALSVNPESVQLAVGAGSKVVTVATDASEWKAVVPEADTWCTLSSKGNELTISAEANTTGEERTTQVTVSAGGAAPCYIKVTQSGESAIPGLPSEVILSVTGKAQTFTALVMGKLTYTVAKGGEWCTVYIQANAVEISASRNNDDKERETVVTVTNGVETVDIVVRQKKAVESDVKVGDLYKENDKVAGIVAYVSEDGEALVFALDELDPNSETISSMWCHPMSAENKFNTTTAHDGQANMKIWRERFASAKEYKAFYVCDQKNKDGAKNWFFPARDELKLISDGITGLGLSKFNEILKRVSGASPIGNYPYWSSTESDADFYNAIAVSISTGGLVDLYKGNDSQCGTRAVRKISSSL